MINAKAVIEKNIDNDELDTALLSKRLRLSNSQLYRKIKALTGNSISEFIRTTRLAKAKQLLKAKHGNVSEIAYQVGMQPGYFTKTFKKLYGIKPKELI